MINNMCKYIYMGQISLPRTEKLGVSMNWESSLNYNEERWAGVKTYLLVKLLCRYMFRYHFRYKKHVWVKNNTCLMSNFFKQNKLKLRCIELLKKKHKALLGHYIYQHNNNYITLVVFSSRSKSKPNNNYIKPKPLLNKIINTDQFIFYKYKIKCYELYHFFIKKTH